MCDLHPNCPTVSMLERAKVPPSRAEDSALAPGFLTLSDEEYRKTIRQCPIESYYDVADVPISMGQWASVFQCRLRSTGAQFAAKFCNKLRMGAPAQAEILHEVAALRYCRRCPRIVQLYEVFETDDQYILVMELGTGGDLQAILDDNQVPYESDVKRFMRNLLEGLVFIHERNLAHLDIKPQNLVLTGDFPDCDVKLCDLEISRVITAGTEVREMLGTPDYVAPEILRFDPVSLTSDIWSVGVLAYVLLTGFTPFGGDTDAETFRNISAAELDFPEELFEDVSELARDFIRRCLVKDPQGRLSARQSLMHPWLQQSESVQRLPSIHGSNQSILSDGFGSQDSVRTLRRSASKSREVLCEKVNNSQLKKNISKSRERLCDLKFGLSKSRERLPRTMLTGGVSRSSEVLGSRPPWRAAGLNCPLGKPLPPPVERMGSFKVRDQYQSQVVAALGSSQSLNTSSQPFVRHCSLRGRKKSPTPAVEPTDFRSSLRRNKKNSGRRSSLQLDSRTERGEERAREGRRRSHSTRDEPAEHGPRLERRRDPRRELSLPPADAKNMIIVEIISDDEQDVFTRLYNDRLKDSELKWRKLRDSDYDDEKENKATHRAESGGHLSVRRQSRGRSHSRESVRLRGSTKRGSDEALEDRIDTLPVSSSREKSTAPTDIEKRRQNDWTDPGSRPQQSPLGLYGEDDQTDGSQTDGSQTDGSRTDGSRIDESQLDKSQTDGSRTDGSQTDDSRTCVSRTDESQTDKSQTDGSRMDESQTLRLLSEMDTEKENLTSELPRTSSQEKKTMNLHADTANSSQLQSQQSQQNGSYASPVIEDIPGSPEVICTLVPADEQSRDASEQASTASDETMAISRTPSISPERTGLSSHRLSDITAPWRRHSSGSEQRWRRPASSSPEPGAEPRRRRQGSSSGPTSVTTERSVNTEAVPTRDRGINTDSVLLATTVSPTPPRWEHAQPLSGQPRQPLPAPAVTTLRGVFERPRRQNSAPTPTAASVLDTASDATSTPTAALSKSPTGEDLPCRGDRVERTDRAARADGDERRSVAFAEADAPRKSSAECYRRCSSLSSDLGSSEVSSEAGSESYCVISWEEVAADQATELKPVLSTRSAGRPRSHSHQLAQLELAKLRQRGRSHSVVAEPFSAAQPWGPLCSGSVARAFEKFHSMAGDSRKRRQSSPNITGLAAKMTDLGEL